MREWIVGLGKAATDRSEGVDSRRWFELEGGVNAVPDELRDLYEAMDGASLPPDVTVLPFFGGAAGASVVERSVHAPGWVFGTKGAHQQLFVARKKDLPNPSGPEWLELVPAEEWVFGLRGPAGDSKYYRSLEQMLARLVPPAQTEDFGELTYVRALSAVQGALGSLHPEQMEEETAPQGAPLSPPLRLAPKPQRKAATKKAKPKRAKAPAKKPSKKKLSAKPVKKSAKVKAKKVKAKKAQPRPLKKKAAKRVAAKKATRKSASKKRKR